MTVISVEQVECQKGDVKFWVTKPQLVEGLAEKTEM